MNRDVVHVRANRRSTSVRKTSATYQGFATVGGPVIPKLNNEVNTSSGGPSNLSLTSDTLYEHVYIAATWDPSPDPNVVAYEVIFDRAGAITTQRTEDTSAWLEPVLPNTIYTVSVYNIYINGVPGTQLATDSILSGSDNTVPSTVQGLSLGTGIRSITVSWDENPEPDTAFGKGRYRVQISDDAAFSNIIADKYVTALVTSFSDLATNTQHWVRVKAVDTSGNESASWTGAVTGTTGQVTGSDIQDLAVENIKIADATIEAAKIKSVNAQSLLTDSAFVNRLFMNPGGSIQTTNYAANPTTAGWYIGPTTAVFNNVTVRGTLEAVSGSFATLTVASGGKIRTAAAGMRTEIGENFLYSGVFRTGMRFYSKVPDEVNHGYIGVDNSLSSLEVRAGENATGDGALLTLGYGFDSTDGDAILQGGNVSITTTAGDLFISAPGNTVDIAGSQVLVTGNIQTTTGYIRAKNGSASAPGFRWSDDNTGFYYTAPLIYVTVDGTPHYRFGANWFAPDTGRDTLNGLGTSGARWSEVWAVDGTINTSDERRKNNLGPSLGLEFVRTLEPFIGKWKKGRGSKKHFWLSAQQVEASLERFGITPGSAYMVQNQDDEYSLVYTELVPITISALKELADQFDTLADRVFQLERGNLPWI